VFAAPEQIKTFAIAYDDLVEVTRSEMLLPRRIDDAGRLLQRYLRPPISRPLPVRPSLRASSVTAPISLLQPSSHERFVQRRTRRPSL